MTTRTRLTDEQVDRLVDALYDMIRHSQCRQANTFERKILAEAMARLGVKYRPLMQKIGADPWLPREVMKNPEPSCSCSRGGSARFCDCQRTALDKVNEVRTRCGMRPIKAGARVECGWCHNRVAATDEGTCPKCGCSAICPPWMS